MHPARPLHRFVLLIAALLLLPFFSAEAAVAVPDSQEARLHGIVLDAELELRPENWSKRASNSRKGLFMTSIVCLLESCCAGVSCVVSGILSTEILRSRGRET